jgi:pimeloyl-[acyl-carrier protein] methyl ester esterase
MDPAEGATRPALVLLPGLDGTDVLFRPLLEHLPRALRPIPLVYPDAGPYGYDELLELVRRALAGVSACYLLAASFSGPLAAMLAAAEPEKVRGIVFTATFVRAPSRQLARFRFAATAPLMWALRVARRVPVWVRLPNDPVRLAKRETWSRVSAGSMAARARAALAADARDALRSCTQPVLCVAFEGDAVVPRRCAEEIAAIAKAPIVTLPGGHLGMFTDPAPLAAAIARFVGAETRLPVAAGDQPLAASTLTTTYTQIGITVAK